MIKSDIKKYIIVFIGITVLFVFFWSEPIFRYMDWLSPNGSGRLLVTMDPIGLAGLYLDSGSVTITYGILYVFALSCIFMTDNQTYIVRLKSRKFYVKQHISDTLIFTLIFVFILEAVNLIGSTILLGFGAVIESHLLLYSMIDFVTVFLYFFRLGILLFIFIVIVGKKYASFVIAALLLLKLVVTNWLPVIDSLWLPSKDASVILALLSGHSRVTGAIPAVIRGLIMDAAVIWFAYFIFMKKDIIVKKENR